MLSCKLFFPFFLWLVASLFVDSEKALLLTGYGTPWVPFGGPLIFLFFRVVSCCWAIRMATICHLALYLSVVSFSNFFSFVNIYVI
jgi:hypothetical protein